MKRMRWLSVAVLSLVLGLSGCGDGEEAASGTAAERGEQLFQGEGTCATCHGADLGGTTMGPPLVHEIYEPGHHPDAAIRAAVRNGVQPHHWDFGPMPQLPHLGDEEIDAIIAYVRQEQRAAGIG